MRYSKIKSELKIGKSVLDIGNYGIQKGGNVQFTDLSTWVKINRVVAPVGNTIGIDAKGIYDTNKQLVNGDNFPEIGELGDFKIGFDLDADMIARFINMKHYMSTDELRIKMSGVYVNKEEFAVTNAHVLKRMKHGIQDSMFKGSEGVIINPSIFNMIDDNASSIIVHEDYTILKTITDGYQTTITSRNIDDVYPNYENVIPPIENYSRHFLFTQDDLKQMLSDWDRVKEDGEHYPQLVIKDDYAHVSGVDKRYKIQADEGSEVVHSKRVDTIIMPVMLWDDYLNKGYTYAVNINLLADASKGASSVKLYPNGQSNRAGMLEFDFCKKKNTVSPTTKLKMEIARLQSILNEHKISY